VLMDCKAFSVRGNIDPRVCCGTSDSLRPLNRPVDPREHLHATSLCLLWGAGGGGTAISKYSRLRGGEVRQFGLVWSQAVESSQPEGGIRKTDRLAFQFERAGVEGLCENRIPAVEQHITGSGINCQSFSREETHPFFRVD